MATPSIVKNFTIITFNASTMEPIITLIAYTCLCYGIIYWICWANGDTNFSIIIIFCTFLTLRTFAVYLIESITANTTAIRIYLVYLGANWYTILNDKFSSNWASVIALFYLRIFWTFLTIISNKIKTWSTSLWLTFTIWYIKTVWAIIHSLII
jgi:hypothetical protein